MGQKSPHKEEIDKVNIEWNTYEISYRPENPFGDSTTTIESQLDVYPNIDLISIQGDSTRVIREIIECINSVMYDEARILPNIGLSRNEIWELVESAELVVEVVHEDDLTTHEQTLQSLDKDKPIEKAVVHFTREDERISVVYNKGHLWISANSDQSYQSIIKNLIDIID
ncbi:hypothetical protein NP511_07660 [Natrinema thermotolerans]|uniref:Uncharacterized protein n=1 Tax=Natrinema thermotolerans TaxID=121872 RepID=A0AAF0PF15_9EURY|nr:hypothetical protein [Natrinema thermotolerans]WMT09506.1 hypothetical protein NP511_07660 [Natrinema thermotolerans]